MHVKYFLVKTLRAFITTFLLVVFVFFVLRITGDPAQAMLPDDATEEDYIEFRQIWGLDKPLMEQFWVYCKNFIHGDFGQSYNDGRDVFEVISQRLPKSVWLMGMSIIFSIVVGLPLGIPSTGGHTPAPSPKIRGRRAALPFQPSRRALPRRTPQEAGLLTIPPRETAFPPRTRSVPDFRAPFGRKETPPA